MVTKYKGVVSGSKSYKRIVELIGKCIKEGGYVDFDHHMVMNRDINGHIVRKDLCDITFHWG